MNQKYYDYCESEREKVLLSYFSESGYITSFEISRKTGYSGQLIRELVNNMRINGIPIIASNKGYRLACDGDEVQEQINSMLGRINQMYKAMKGLKRAKLSFDFYKNNKAA